MSERTCGVCNLCCKLYNVPELDKPRDTWCTNCRKGKGCGIYPDWPAVCQDFFCLWRDERLAYMLPNEVRPDRCGVVLTAAFGGKDILATSSPDKPFAWRDNAVVYGFLKRCAASGASVSARSGNAYFVIGSRGWFEVPHEWHGEDAADGTFAVKVPNELRARLGIGGAVA
jgi:hypothetical protein